MRRFEPSDAQFDEWRATLVPEETVYWVNEALLSQLPTALVFPRAEYVQHPVYRTPRLANAYHPWAMHDDVTHVIRTASDYTKQLPTALREALLAFQLKANRGLVLPLATPFSSPDTWIDETGQAFVVLHRALWDDLPPSIQDELLVPYAKQWDVWEGLEAPVGTPSHVRRVVQTFPHIDGVNCLAATLYAVTGDTLLLAEWVHPETFMETLRRVGYEPIEHDTPQAGDVVTFWNEANRLVHASFCIEPNVYFNKNGQVRFNPFNLITHDELLSHWGQMRIQLERNE